MNATVPEPANHSQARLSIRVSGDMTIMINELNVARSGRPCHIFCAFD